jgi:hypothetical protein
MEDIKLILIDKLQPEKHFKVLNFVRWETIGQSKRICDVYPGNSHGLQQLRAVLCTKRARVISINRIKSVTHKKIPGKFGNPVSSEQGGKTPQAVLTAYCSWIYYRLGVGWFGVLLYCTFNGTVTASNLPTLYA